MGRYAWPRWRRGIAPDRGGKRDEVAGLEYGRGTGQQPESEGLMMEAIAEIRKPIRLSIIRFN